MLVKDTEYFTTAETSQRFDLIRHLIENCEIIPLVRGPSGIGKSLLAARIQQTAPENWSVCLLEASPALSPEQLLTTIARCSGSADLQDDPLQSLIRRFASMKTQGQLPVVLVDEAHLLQPTALLTLLRLYERQQAGEPLVSIVLFADERIDMLLSTPQLQIMSPQSIQVIDLQALTKEEATSFMHFLLQVEGLAASLELSSAKMTKLYRETKGIPGLMRQAISDAFGEKEEGKGIKKIRPMLYLVVFLITIIGGMLWFQESINQLFDPLDNQVEQLSDAQQVIRESTQASAQIPEEISSQPVSETWPLAQQKAGASLFNDRYRDAMGQVEEVAPSNRIVSTEVDASTSDAAAGVKIDARLLKETDALSGAENGIDSVPVPKEAVGDEPEVPQNSHPEQTEGVDQRAAESVVVAVDTKPLLEEALGEQNSIDLLRDREWVYSRPAKHYTLQLLGVESLESLESFVKQNALTGDVFYLKTQRKGKPWYPLLWGEFPDKSSAIKAQHDLPPKVRRQGIWARTFADLQRSYDH